MEKFLQFPAGIFSCETKSLKKEENLFIEEVMEESKLGAKHQVSSQTMLE